MPARVANLDLLRAVAIGLVVLSNAASKSLAPSPLVEHLLLSGWMGVDLFFVLSGWLIGGLYWRERDQFSDFHLLRFWGRRWMRTIPPYLIALHLVFLAQHLATGGGEPYRALYLVFGQNYMQSIPYWAVSWSLCVEEHFYLAMPLVLAAAARVRNGVLPVLGVLAVVSLGARMLLPLGAVEDVSGLAYTATHMRLEGLVLGLAASYVYARHPGTWEALVGACRRHVLSAIALLVVVAFLPLPVTLRLGFTLVDVAMAVILVAVADRAPLPGAATRGVRAVSITSYSVYMTHTVALEAVTRLPGSPPAAVEFGIAIALVGVVGGAFYVLVEKPTMRLRERLVPRRRGERSEGTGHVGPPPADIAGQPAYVQA